MKLVAVALFTVTLVSSPLQAQSVLYAFDTVTAVEMHLNSPSVTGLAKNTLAPLTVQFVDTVNISYRYAVNRCLPLIITAMEKPGRYYLYLTVDPNEQNLQLRNCKLEIKR